MRSLPEQFSESESAKANGKEEEDQTTNKDHTFVVGEAPCRVVKEYIRVDPRVDPPHDLSFEITQ